MVEDDGQSLEVPMDVRENRVANSLVFPFRPWREPSSPRPEGGADRSVTTTPAFGRTRCPRRKGSATTDR
jgi:hypothetical protein